jgi:four helix bundle protein
MAVARELTRRVYELTKKQRFAKDFGLKGQIQKASASSMNNIAEGFDADANTGFIRFLRYAKRSCSEVQSELYIAPDQRYITDLEFHNVYDFAGRTRATIRGFIRYLLNVNRNGKREKRDGLLSFSDEANARNAIRSAGKSGRRSAVRVVGAESIAGRRIPGKLRPAFEHPHERSGTRLVSVGHACCRSGGPLLLPDRSGRARSGSGVTLQPVGCSRSQSGHRSRKFRLKRFRLEGKALGEAVVYELHVGAFTAQGTFRGVMGRLDYLEAPGITAIDQTLVCSLVSGRMRKPERASLDDQDEIQKRTAEVQDNRCPLLRFEIQLFSSGSGSSSLQRSIMRRAPRYRILFQILLMSVTITCLALRAACRI